MCLKQMNWEALSLFYIFVYLFFGLQQLEVKYFFISPKIKMHNQKLSLGYKYSHIYKYSSIINMLYIYMYLLKAEISTSIYFFNEYHLHI